MSRCKDALGEETSAGELAAMRSSRLIKAGDQHGGATESGRLLERFEGEKGRAWFTGSREGNE